MHIRTYDTVSVATTELYKKGYVANFVLDGDRMQETETRKHYTPQDMKVLEFYRFEGESDPADNSIVFAVECKDGTRGVVVASYGPTSSKKLDDFMKEVEVVDKTEAAGPIHQHTSSC